MKLEGSRESLRRGEGPSGAGMRRHYPGHQSYSLGNLCATYDIDLKEHHGGLCDARAAAQLLNLINRKREERPETSGVNEQALPISSLISFAESQPA